MRTIYFDKNIPKALAAKALRPIWKGVTWSPLSPISVVDLPEPALPGPRWIRVRNRQCGICASDLSILFVKVDPSIALAPLPGNPRIYLGHEVVSQVVEVGPGITHFKPGDRVVMESRFGGPTCASQEVGPPCPQCARGRSELCENTSLGIGPRGVGGGWSDGYTAHESEVHPVPADLNDDQAAMIEPLSVALHGVLRRAPQPGEQVLVVGAGIIGLLTVQAIKAVCPEARLTIVARYPHQAEAARALGADTVIGRGDLYAEGARLTGAKYYTGPLNRGMLLGGYDVIYDCVGSGRTISDALRWARAGGTVVLLGIHLEPVTADLNPVWWQQVDLIGSGYFSTDEWQGRRQSTFAWTIEWLRSGRFRVDGLISHRFPLAEYKRAIATATDKSNAKAIKVMFQMD